MDIYAQEAGTGRKVIIENQLEETNHDHLGKVFTYAAGKGAQVIIWLSPMRVTSTVKRLSGLTSTATTTLASSLLRLSFWTAGDQAGPRFNVVEQPNEWTKALRLSENLSETERVKLSYWTKYREIARVRPYP